MPPSDLKQPATAGLGDLAWLGFGLTRSALRRPLDMNAEAVFRSWARRTAKRLKGDDLMINLGVKKLLLVGSAELSRHILTPPPSLQSFSAGSLKRAGMAFLAAHALTISDDEEWVRRRAFNEAVLQPDRRHELAATFVRATVEAFEPPVNGLWDLRAAMGRAMLGVVFAGEAPASLVKDMEFLFGLVQAPVKRMLLAPYAYWKRRRLYERLRTLWRAQRTGARPSLLNVAARADSVLDEAEMLEQVPHWMFTFTGSATDLLTRTLALISAYPSVHRRVMAELAAAGPVGGESFATADLTFLEACLWEAAYLYPPVTRTFHRAANCASIGTVQIPAGTEIMHLFPLFTSDGMDRSRRFDPDRWLKDDPPVYPFDPFLGGARRCPGERLILLICKTALASLLTRHQTVVLAPGIGVGPLPAVFPRHGVQVLRCC